MKMKAGKIENNGWSVGFSRVKTAVFSGLNAEDDFEIKSDRTFGSILNFLIVLNFTAAVLACLLETVSRPYLPINQIAHQFVNSFVYANCIGFPVGFAVLNAAPRLMGLRFPLNFFLLAAMIFALGFVGIITAGLTLMKIGGFRADDYSWFSPRRMAFDFLIAFIFGFGTYIYESVRLRLNATTERLRVKELEEERAQKLAVEASLSSLESRVRPHFLFNTLNTISSLIQKNTTLAERMVERLAALLRFSLDSNLRETIPLEQELKIVADYLEIERARFGKRLRYRIDVPAELKKIAVPPFAVQIPVENSVKHGISRQKKGGEIRVKARADDDQIKIEVWDDGAGFAPDTIPPGHGLDNLRSRLGALFERKAALEVLRENDWTIVRIILPNQQNSGVKTK